MQQYPNADPSAPQMWPDTSGQGGVQWPTGSPWSAEPQWQGGQPMPGEIPDPPPSQWAPVEQRPPQNRTPLILLLSAIGAVVLVVLVVGAVNMASAIRAGNSSPDSQVVPTLGASDSSNAGGSGDPDSSVDSGGSGYSGGSDYSEEPEASSASLSAGDCIEMLSPSRAAPVYRPALCGSDSSDFVVAGMLRDTTPKCPSMAYVQLTLPGGGGYCLRMDVERGDCVNLGGTDRVETKVSCSSDSATAMITTADRSGADEALCSPDSQRYVLYPEPGVTVCWKRLSGI